MKIYTRTGDEGDTGLFGGGRVSKGDRRVAAYGDVDELNAALGAAASFLGAADPVRARVEEIQGALLGIGGEIATASESARGKLRGLVSQEHVDRLEASIDEMERELPALTQFILPAGSPAGAAFHVARTVCRRAERSIVALSVIPPLRAEIVRFLNRLSDWLFVAARYTNQQAGVPERPW